MKKFITILFFIFILTSCAKKEVQVQYVTKLADLPDCPRPERTKLEELNVAQHLGSTSNVNSIDENMISLITYITRLEATIDCYEKRKTANSETKESTSDTRKN